MKILLLVIVGLASTGGAEQKIQFKDLLAVQKSADDFYEKDRQRLVKEKQKRDEETEERNQESQFQQALKVDRGTNSSHYIFNPHSIRGVNRNDAIHGRDTRGYMSPQDKAYSDAADSGPVFQQRPN